MHVGSSLEVQGSTTLCKPSRLWERLTVCFGLNCLVQPKSFTMMNCSFVRVTQEKRAMKGEGVAWAWQVKVCWRGAVTSPLASCANESLVSIYLSPPLPSLPKRRATATSGCSSIGVRASPWAYEFLSRSVFRAAIRALDTMDAIPLSPILSQSTFKNRAERSIDRLHNGCRRRRYRRSAEAEQRVGS